MRTIEWDEKKQYLKIIDQRQLPEKCEYIYLSNYKAIADSIRSMAVRGAPAIGVTAAYGMVLAGYQSPAKDRKQFLADLQAAAKELEDARPTAVNLPWALKRMLSVVEDLEVPLSEIKIALLTEANEMAEEDIVVNKTIAKNGAPLINDGDTIIHHCNTGALATVDWGTALGIIRFAFEEGKHIHVLVDETRPRLQGARLTAWELQQLGIPFDIISDNAAGYFLSTGQVQKVFFGADRVAANGDVANKVGSYMLALAAKDNAIPVYSVFPTSTVDLSIQNGKQIPIEERDQEEVLALSLKGQRVMPEGATARNPAFDVTPARLITAYVTELGVVRQPFSVHYKEYLRLKEG
ncbi:MAG: S-methyl-5-thioribose-1-phosphate isomerase [Anaerolineaceae bacterium]|jgi:methylthioribose-1-phosphate isomerase|nr:MAG: S-methyl-5-thioribose-1-phosphate isomerase [Anaerolineaceae bacterium]